MAIIAIVVYEQLNHVLMVSDTSFFGYYFMFIYFSMFWGHFYCNNIKIPLMSVGYEMIVANAVISIISHPKNTCRIIIVQL